MANFKTRIKQKNDTTEHWNKANTEGFKPLQGEIIVYNDVNRIKIGDGTNTVSNVPFLDANCVHLTGAETIDGYKTFKKHITINGSISNSDIMLSATDAANNPGMAGEIAWHDGEGNDGAVYIPQGQGETLATTDQIPDVINNLTSTSSTDALSANQGYILNNNKAPNNHASSATTYGVGTAANYGHVKLVTGDMNGKANADGQVPSLNHTHSQYAPKASPTFTGTVTLSGTTTPLSVNSTVGAAGQVLTSQGMGKSPIWKDVPIPGNMVTTDANQTITGYKTFQGGIELNECSAVFANVANSGSANYIIDCYENSGDNDSLFAVKALGQNKGQVLFGDGTVDCSINFGEGSYITSDMLLCPAAGKTAYPQLQVSKSYVAIKTSASAGTFYYDGYIVRTHSNASPTNISLPSSAGTLALTSQIPSASNFVTTNTVQTITGKKTITEAVISHLTLNNGLYTSSSYGTFGQALISGGGKAYLNSWKTITASDNISISYAIGSASSVNYGSGNYGTNTSMSFTGYKVAADILNLSGQLSSTKYIHVYTTEFTKNVAAGRWVRFKGWRSNETILSVIVTPSKNTTAGYGPRLISWFTGEEVYVAADDDNDEKGFSITVITQGAN